MTFSINDHSALGRQSDVVSRGREEHSLRVPSSATTILHLPQGATALTTSAGRMAGGASRLAESRRKSSRKGFARGIGDSKSSVRTCARTHDVVRGRTAVKLSERTTMTERIAPHPLHLHHRAFSSSHPELTSRRDTRPQRTRTRPSFVRSFVRVTRATRAFNPGYSRRSSLHP